MTFFFTFLFFFLKYTYIILIHKESNVLRCDYAIVHNTTHSPPMRTCRYTSFCFFKTFGLTCHVCLFVFLNPQFSFKTGNKFIQENPRFFYNQSSQGISYCFTFRNKQIPIISLPRKNLQVQLLFIIFLIIIIFFSVCRNKRKDRTTTFLYKMSSH